VKRAYIPKGTSATETRPIGIPTLEDKVLQRAVVLILDAIYEQDFYDCSHGFRRGRSTHPYPSWAWFERLLKRYPLPPAIPVHSVCRVANA